MLFMCTCCLQDSTVYDIDVGVSPRQNDTHKAIPWFINIMWPLWNWNTYEKPTDQKQQLKILNQ